MCGWHSPFCCATYAVELVWLKCVYLVCSTRLSCYFYSFSSRFINKYDDSSISRTHCHLMTRENESCSRNNNARLELVLNYTPASPPFAHVMVYNIPFTRREIQRKAHVHKVVFANCCTQITRSPNS